MSKKAENQPHRGVEVKAETSETAIPMERVLENLNMAVERINQRLQQLETNREAPRGDQNQQAPPPPQRGGYRGGGNRGPIRGRWVPNDDELQQGYDEMYEEEQFEDYHGNQRGRFRERNREDDEIKGLNMKIPTFQGKTDPDVYLEWEKRIEMVFDCKHYSEAQKVKVASLEFTDYALNWWDKLMATRRRNRERPISTWDEMRTLMRKRFIPAHYHRDVLNRLNRLIQGSKEVEEYYKELEVLMLKANIDEDEERCMSRFMT